MEPEAAAAVKRPAEEAAAGDDGRNIRLKTEAGAVAAPVPEVLPRREEKLPVLRYREGEPLVELVQHLAAAATSADEAAAGAGAGAVATAPGGEPEGANGAAGAGPSSSSSSLPLPPRVEVRVPADAASNQNRQVRARQLWGTDVYTHDSDVVAVLMHQGYYSHALSAPPPQLAEVRAVLRVLPPRRRYEGSSRNCVRSRGWASAPDDDDEEEEEKEGGVKAETATTNAGGTTATAVAAAAAAAAAAAPPPRRPPRRGLEGCAFAVERAYVVLRGGAQAALRPCGPGTPPPLPTFRPAAPSDRAVSTRSTSAAAASDRRARAAAEVALQYSLSGEPWLKYSTAAVADRGLKRHQWTSARLGGSVLFLETHAERFELSRVGAASSATAAADAAAAAGGGEAGEANGGAGTTAAADGKGGGFRPPDTFRWAKVSKPFPLRAMRRLGLPLPASALEQSSPSGGGDGGITLLKWEEIAWGQAAVMVKGKSVPVVRVLFTPRCDARKD